MLWRPALPARRAAADDRNRRAGIGQADPPAEEQVGLDRRRGERAAGAHLELAGVLQEEVALLGKEQAEAGQVHLLLVDFDLREVGVVGDVEVHAAGDAVFQVEADVAQERRRLRSRRAGLRIAHAADDVRLQLEIEPVAERLQADEAAGHG